MEGGYLIPPAVRVKRKGLFAAWLRFIGNDDGWKTIDLERELITAFEKKGEQHDQETY